MNVTWSRCIATFTLVGLASLSTPIVLAQTPDTSAVLQARVRDLEKTHQRLLEETRQKRKVGAAVHAIDDEDSARKSEET